MNDEITQDKGNSRDIIFNPDGIKLGWSVLAIIASIGLGLYVSNIVQPLKKDLENLAAQYKKVDKKEQELRKDFGNHILQCTKENAEIRTEIVNVERKLEIHEANTKVP